MPVAQKEDFACAFEEPQAAKVLDLFFRLQAPLCIVSVQMSHMRVHLFFVCVTYAHSQCIDIKKISWGIVKVHISTIIYKVKAPGF